MTRIVSTSFLGVSARDVVRGALVSGTRWLRPVIGDTALTADRILGLNGATVIDHSGAPNGCELGMPLWCQAIPARSITPANTGIYYVAVVPIYVAAGETYRDWKIEVDMTASLRVAPPFWEVRDTSFAVEQTGSLEVTGEPWSDGSSPYRGTCPALDAGWHFLCIAREISSAEDEAAFMGGRMFPLADPYLRAVGVPIGESATVGSPFSAIASFAPSEVVDFHEEEVFGVTTYAAADVGVNGWVMTRLAKLQNTLWEWITGARIPGNENRQVTPVRTHDRSVFTAEGEIDMPIVAIALGGSTRDGSKNIAGEFASWHRQTTHDVGSPSSITVSQATVRMPDFDDGSSVVTCKVIACEEASNATRWEFRVTSAAGSSSWVALSSLDTVFYAATITGVPFTAGADNVFTLECRHTIGGGGVTSDEIAITGWSLAHTP